MHATALFAFTWALWGGQVGRLEKGLPQIFWGSGSAEHSSQMQSLCLLGSTMCVCVSLPAHGTDTADRLHLLDGSGVVVVLCFLTWLFLRCAVGWGSDQGIGGFGEEPGIKAQLTNLIRSIRTVMRGEMTAVVWYEQPLPVKLCCCALRK